MTTETEEQAKRKRKKRLRPEGLDNSRWATKYDVTESSLRDITVPALQDLLEAQTGDSAKDKAIAFEGVVGIGTGTRKDVDRGGGETTKELIEKGRPITPQVLKKAIRWFVDKGKELPSAVRLASALFQKLQMRRYQVTKLADLDEAIARPIKEALDEAERTPDPNYARHLIGEVLKSHIPADANPLFQPPLRPKSY